MGHAGKALKEVLKNYQISQNRLAVELGIGRSNVYRWVHEIRDPTAETVRDIIKVLRKINPAAVDDFIGLYLDADPLEEEKS